MENILQVATRIRNMWSYGFTRDEIVVLLKGEGYEPDQIFLYYKYAETWASMDSLNEGGKP